MGWTGPAAGSELAPPDIILISPEWRERALLRAQLIEERHDVLALDAWPIPAAYRRAGMKPRLLVIDLHGLPDPRQTLDEVRFVIPPERVLVISALGTLPEKNVRRLGFHVIERPTSVAEIVDAVTHCLTARNRFRCNASTLVTDR